MKNPRLTNKDYGLIKAALRSAFARSDLHKQVIEESIVQHSDPKRKRVKTWCKCAICGKPEAKSYMIVDHIQPFVPIHMFFEDMDLTDAVNRLWCELINLQCVDEVCHNEKSQRENSLRPKKQRKKKEKVS